MADTTGSTTSDAKDKVVRRDPEDPKSDPVLDFATFADAEAQAKALGKGARVEPIGTAYHVATDSDE